MKRIIRRMIWNWELLCLLLRLGDIICMVLRVYHLTDSQKSSTIFDQRSLNMRQGDGLSCLVDYECEISYHSGKSTVMADALSGRSALQPRQQENYILGESAWFDQQMKEGGGLASKAFGFAATTMRYLNGEEKDDLLSVAWQTCDKKALEQDASLHVPLDEIKVDRTLHFVEEPVEIMDREVKSLKRSKIALVKVRWNSKHGPEFTWECEDYMDV
ncbi:hypothetical protein Tco_1428178 [Tanacetum coccineum]